MCVNCKVFDNIKLPYGYQKEYIEWYIPEPNETLKEYTIKMAEHIDITEPFIFIGYSLGGIIVQEMNAFLSPEKNILISTIKAKEEIPSLFAFAKKTRFTEYLPEKLYTVNKTISGLFTKLVYNMTSEEIEKYITYTSNRYMKWATRQIINWKPSVECNNLYHIHGTKDQVFPYKKIKNTYTIDDGDHLMIIRRSEEISRILKDILKF